MKKPFIGIAIGWMLTASTGALAQALVWRVSEASGQVVIRRGAEQRVAQRGALLAEGDVVSTRGGGRAVLVHDRDFVTVSPNSEVALPRAVEASGMVKLIQSIGNAIYKIEKLGVPHFGVKTPYLAAVVKGTTFSVTVDGIGSSLQVTEGAVEVATIDGGARDLIRPGGVATIAAADLYRLQVHGDQERTIDSPARAAAPAAASPDTTAAPVASAPAATTSVANPAESAGGRGSAANPTAITAGVIAVAAPAPVSPSDRIDRLDTGSSMIAEAVFSKPTDLGTATGGLLTGTVRPPAAMVTAVLAALTTSDVKATAAPAGGGRGDAAGAIPVNTPPPVASLPAKSAGVDAAPAMPDTGAVPGPPEAARPDAAPPVDAAAPRPEKDGVPTSAGSAEPAKPGTEDLSSPAGPPSPTPGGAEKPAPAGPADPGMVGGEDKSLPAGPGTPTPGMDEKSAPAVPGVDGKPAPAGPVTVGVDDKPAPAGPGVDGKPAPADPATVGVDDKPSPAIPGTPTPGPDGKPAPADPVGPAKPDAGDKPGPAGPAGPGKDDKSGPSGPDKPDVDDKPDSGGPTGLGKDEKPGPAGPADPGKDDKSGAGGPDKPDVDDKPKADDKPGPGKPGDDKAKPDDTPDRAGPVTVIGGLVEKAGNTIGKGIGGILRKIRDVSNLEP